MSRGYRKRDSKTYVARFDSLSASIYAARAGRYDFGSAQDSWYGNRTKAQAIKDALDLTLATDAEVNKAKELMDKIDASFRDREVTQWMPSVAGAYPIVPDYLMGQVECMRARKPVESDIAPLKVYIDTCVSAGVSKQELMNRGVALAAFVMRLAEIRPVELHLYYAIEWSSCRGNHCFVDIKLDSTPISVLQLMNTIPQAAFVRTVAYNTACKVAQDNGDTVNWKGRGAGPSEVVWWAHIDLPNAKDLIRADLDLEPQDILFERGFLTSARLMGQDPVKWVHDELEKQRAIEQ